MSYHCITYPPASTFAAGSTNFAIPFACIKFGRSVDVRGADRLAGDAPDGLVKSNDTPVARPVRIYHRATGELVAEVMSASDGTWQVTGLTSAVDFDVQFMGTASGERDVLVPKVRAS